MPDTVTTAEQVSRLREAHAQSIEWLKAETEYKQHMLERRTIESADVITAEAEASITFIILKGHVTAALKFGSGQRMNFDAWPWGVGAAGGTGYGLYYGVGPATLAGGCSYHCQGGAEGGGFFQITCWRDGFGALGQVNVAMVGVGAFEIGGNDGWWSFA